MQYPWISNISKFERAKGELGAEATEAELKAKYISYGGLVLGEPVSQEKVAAPVEALVEEELFVGTTDDIPAEPVKKVKKTKK